MHSSDPTISRSSALSRMPRPDRIIPIVATGLIIGTFQVAHTASLATLIFNGPLADYVGAGIGLALLGGIVSGVAVALLGSLPGTVGGLQGAPVAILTVMAGVIVAAVPNGASSKAAFLTVAATIAATTLSTGASLLALGYFRLGKLVRFLPYPVVGGFLAGTGWLLFRGGLSTMSGLSLTLANLPAFVEPAVLLTWLPGLLWAIAAFLIMRRFGHPLLLPALIVLGVGLLYGVAWLAGLSIERMGELGLLLARLPDSQLWTPLSIADLGLINWPLILGQTLSIGTIIIVSMVGVLLNASALEVTFDQEINLDQELRAAGAANLLAGLRGGFVGFQQLSTSALALSLKGASRWSALIAAMVCGLFLAFGGQALHLFPTGILGGLVLLVGLDFLYKWLVEVWSGLPRQDYAIIVVIVLTTAVAGFLEAVILGLLIAIILFAISYSWADVIRAELNGATYRSRVTRSRQQQIVLDQAVGRLAIFQLQGFIFFGTAHTISNRVRERIAGAAQEKPDYAILDFSRVNGLDSTASISFRKLILEAQQNGVTLLFAAMRPAIGRQLLQSGLGALHDRFLVFPSLDKGVEWCEKRLLAESGPAAQVQPPPLLEQLSQILGRDRGVAALMGYMKRLEVEPGLAIMAEGDPADAMYFVESGRVTAQLTRGEGEPIRLQSMASGNIVGEIGFYLGGRRTADVVADEKSVVYLLTLPDLQRMEAEEPQLAATLHHLVAILLSERVAHLTAVVDSVSDHRP